MFKLLEIKNYDKHNSYGTDWCTDYYFETDMDLDINGVITELQKLGHNPCGECNLVGNVLKTIMY